MKTVFLTISQYDALRELVKTNQWQVRIMKTHPPIIKKQVRPEFREKGLNFLWQQRDYCSCGVCAINNLMQNEELTSASEPMDIGQMKSILRKRAFQIDELTKERLSSMQKQKGVVGLLAQEKITDKFDGTQCLHWVAFKKMATEWAILDSRMSVAPEFCPDPITWMEENDHTHHWQGPILLVAHPRRWKVWKKAACKLWRKEAKAKVKKLGVKNIWSTELATLEACSGACAIQNLLQRRVPEARSKSPDSWKKGGVAKVLNDLGYKVDEMKMEVDSSKEKNEGAPGREGDENIIGYLFEKNRTEQRPEGHVLERPYWTALKMVGKNYWVFFEALNIPPTIASDELKDFLLQYAGNLRVLKVWKEASREGVALPAESHPAENRAPKASAAAADKRPEGDGEVSKKEKRSSHPPANETIPAKSAGLQIAETAKKQREKENEDPRTTTRAVPCDNTASDKKCYLKIFLKAYDTARTLETLHVNQYFSKQQLTPELYEGGQTSKGNLVLLMERYDNSFSAALQEMTRGLQKNEDVNDISDNIRFYIDETFRVLRNVAQRGWFLADVKTPNIVVNTADSTPDKALRVIDIEIEHVSSVEKDAALVKKFEVPTVCFTYNVTMLYLLKKFVYRYHHELISNIVGKRIDQELKKYHFTLPTYDELKKSRFIRLVELMYRSYHIDRQNRSHGKVPPLRDFWLALSRKINGSPQEIKKTYAIGRNYPIIAFQPPRELPPPLSSFTLKLVQREIPIH
jgi:hypothetical protein